MYKIFSSHIAYAFIISFLLCVVPQDLLAAQLSYKVVPTSKDGDTTTVVEVRIDPQGKNLNVIEGTVSLQGSIADSLSVEVSKQGSALSMWPVEPVYNSKGKTVRFVGGTPEGLAKEGLVLTLHLRTAVSGNIDMTWSGVKTYLNDGKGTEESTIVKSMSLNLVVKDSQITTEEVDGKIEEPTEEKTIFPGFSMNNNVIILLVIILLGGIFYGYKKSTKN